MRRRRKEGKRREGHARQMVIGHLERASERECANECM